MKKLLIGLILFYQKYLSPLKSTKCPYFPSCSQYGLEAVRQYGALKGGLLSVWRILRCNPFSKGGYDPVPIPSMDSKNSTDSKNMNNKNNFKKRIKTFYWFSS